MVHYRLIQIDPQALVYCDLHAEAQQHVDNPTLEAYQIILDGQAQRAEVLYFGDRNIAGIAWGADAHWIECVNSVEDACAREFGADAKQPQTLEDILHSEEEEEFGPGNPADYGDN